MAAIRPRRRSNGATSYAVTWRLGARQCETFHDKRKARDFKTDVEDAGGRWPEGWVKGIGEAAGQDTALDFDDAA